MVWIQGCITLIREMKPESHGEENSTAQLKRARNLSLKLAFCLWMVWKGQKNYEFNCKTFFIRGEKQNFHSSLVKLMARESFPRFSGPLMNKRFCNFSVTLTDRDWIKLSEKTLIHCFLHALTPFSSISRIEINLQSNYAGDFPCFRLHAVYFGIVSSLACDLWEKLIE